MQRGLVGEGAFEQRDPVVFVCQGQAVEPSRPALLQVTKDADRVPTGPGSFRVDNRWCVHGAFQPGVYFDGAGTAEPAWARWAVRRRIAHSATARLITQAAPMKSALLSASR